MKKPKVFMFSVIGMLGLAWLFAALSGVRRQHGTAPDGLPAGADLVVARRAGGPQSARRRRGRGVKQVSGVRC